MRIGSSFYQAAERSAYSPTEISSQSYFIFCQQLSYLIVERDYIKLNFMSDLVSWLVFCHINRCGLFNAKFCLYKGWLFFRVIHRALLENYMKPLLCSHSE